VGVFEKFGWAERCSSLSNARYDAHLVGDKTQHFIVEHG